MKNVCNYKMPKVYSNTKYVNKKTYCLECKSHALLTYEEFSDETIMLVYKNCKCNYSNNGST